MSALAAIQRRVPVRLSTRSATVLALMTGWTVVVVAGFLGEVPARAALPVLLLGLALPPALVARILFWRTPPDPAVRWAAGWSAIVVGAFLLGPPLSASPVTALAVPGVLVLGAVCARFPAAAVSATVLISGSYGSLLAFTGLSGGQLIDGLLVGLWLSTIWIYLLRGRDRPVWVWPGIVGVTFYIALSAFEIVTASSIANGFYAFRGVAWHMLPFLLVGYAWWRPGTRALIAKAVLAIACLVGLYACFRYVVGPAAEEVVVSRSDRTNRLEGKLRLIGSFPSGKALAAWCAILVPFAVAQALAMRDTRWRLVAVLAASACSFALLGTSVRTGVIGVVTGVALVILLFQASRAFPGPQLGITVTAILATLVVGAGVFAFTAGKSESSTDRYTVILTPSQDPAFQSRLVRWRTVLAEIDRHPFGLGLGTSGRVQRERGRFANISSYDVDNSYLQIAYEQGLAVMVLFIVATLSLLVGLARRAIATANRQAAGIAIGACGALWSYLTVLPTGSYLEGLGTLAVWTIVGLGIGYFSGAEEPAGGSPQAERPAPAGASGSAW